MSSTKITRNPNGTVTRTTRNSDGSGTSKTVKNGLFFDRTISTTRFKPNR